MAVNAGVPANLAQLLQRARRNPIGAAFIFLDLLKSQPDQLTELLLAEAKHIPAQP